MTMDLMEHMDFVVQTWGKTTFVQKFLSTQLIVGNYDDSFDWLVEIFSTYKVAPYVRVILLNPPTEKLF